MAEIWKRCISSANNVICVYEIIPLCYVHNVIDRPADRELHADNDWYWLKAAIQANRLDVTSSGEWQDPKKSPVEM